MGSTWRSIRRTSCPARRSSAAISSIPSGSSLRKIFEYMSELGWTARIFMVDHARTFQSEENLDKTLYQERKRLASTVSSAWQPFGSLRAYRQPPHQRVFDPQTRPNLLRFRHPIMSG